MAERTGADRFPRAYCGCGPTHVGSLVRSPQHDERQDQGQYSEEQHAAYEHRRHFPFWLQTCVVSMPATLNEFKPSE